MSSRLNQEREQKLQPKRIGFAKTALQKAGVEITHEDNTRVQFLFKGEKCTLFPYSGWHTGKSIVDGRGLDKLLKQLKSK